MKQYIENSKVKIVTEFDPGNNKVQYHKDLKWRNIKQLKDEEMVRAVLFAKLVNEYGYEISNIENEREYKAGRPHTRTCRIDLIVKNKGTNKNGEQDTYLFIELKKPSDFHSSKQNDIIEEQLFKVAACEWADGRKVKYT